MRRGVLLALPLLLFTACTLGPDYRRPEVPLPTVFRGLDPTAPGGPGSLADVAWWTLFEDEALQALIRTALVENYDLRLAAARILDAQAQVVITRSNQFPTVEGTAEAPFATTFGDRPPLFTLENSFIAQGGLSLSFELDFWGRWRRATEAARADLLASAEGRHVVLSDLVSSVAIAYFQLRTLDLSLEIAQRTVGLRRDSLQLVQLREEGGVVSLMDVYQAETLLSGALREIPDFERQIEQTENLISVLLGQNPGPIARGRSLEGQISRPALPAGLPAALLERRPDVRLAEQQLVAANARIGVAKSEFFPRIFLLGNIGVAGGVQDSVSFGPMGFFGIGPTLTVPIFNMGRVQAGVDSAEARAQEAVTPLSADRPASPSRGVGRPGRASQATGGPAGAGDPRPGPAERHEALEPALRRGGDELSRGPGQRAPALLRGAGPGAGPAGRAVGAGRALPGARRRLGAVTPACRGRLSDRAAPRWFGLDP